METWLTLYIKHQKIKSIIVLFHKKSDRQNFYFHKNKISKVNVKQVSMEEDNACEIVNGELDAKSCIYVNESLTKENRDLSLFLEAISACAAIRQSCEIHYSFASYGGNIICTYRANRTECQ